MVNEDKQLEGLPEFGIESTSWIWCGWLVWQVPIKIHLSRRMYTEESARSDGVAQVDDVVMVDESLFENGVQM